MLFPLCADPKRQFDSTLRALLAVKKTELQGIEAALQAVKSEQERRKKRSTIK
jgi:hypothetical protein